MSKLIRFIVKPLPKRLSPASPDPVSGEARYGYIIQETEGRYKGRVRLLTSHVLIGNYDYQGDGKWTFAKVGDRAVVRSGAPDQRTLAFGRIVGIVDHQGENQGIVPAEKILASYVC